MLPLMLSWALAEPPEVVRIPVAGRDLHPGDEIRRSSLDMERMLPAYIPDDALVDREKLTGRVVRETILEGEMIRPERLAPPQSLPGLAAAVPPGMQLVRLEPTLPAPPLAPGSTVDVIDGVRFCTALEAVTVLGVEDAAGVVHSHGQPTTQRAWHLVVTAEQVPVLVALETYTVALRSVIDVGKGPSELLCE